MHRYLIFISAGLSLLMYSIDSTVVAVAFPNFIKDFGTNVLWAAWTMSIYLIAVTNSNFIILDLKLFPKFLIMDPSPR
jgi:MFS family permease